MQNRWLQTRRHFYEILKKQAYYILGKAPKELLNYENRYRQIFEQVWEVSSVDLIHERMKSNAHIVIGGDFHSFSQSQRAHLRLLREVQKSRSDIIIGLEVFDHEDQEILNAYLNGDINLKALFGRSQWKEKWQGIPTHGYEVMLEWAKKSKLKVMGLNNSLEPKLKQRDRFSAAVIDEVATQYPDHLIYVLYGDFHLADEHLIKHIKSYNQECDMRIFLNSDELYFALAEHAVEDRFDVLSLKDCFCILSSPPWVKWQSYLLSLQEMEDEFIDDQEDWGVDLTEYVAQILDLMVKDFEQQDLSSSLSVYSANEVDLEHIYNQEFTEEELKKIEYLVSTEKNILFPKKGFQYLGRTTVNQAASLAGEILHAHLAKREFAIWKEGLSFEAKVWIEAVSFFLSLTINPSRKAMSEKDLNVQLKAHGEKEYAQEVLELALDYRLSIVHKARTGKARPLTLMAKNWETELEASVILGEIMGKRMFEVYRKGEIERETLIHYFSLPLDSLKFNAMFDFLNSKLEN